MKKSSTSFFPQKSAALIFAVIATVAVSGVIFTSVGYTLRQKSPKPMMTEKVNEVQPVATPTTTVAVTEALELAKEPTTVPKTPTTNGADLKHIKYTLPLTWEAKIDENNLFLSPKENGGYLSIRVYDYPQNVGRREYLCKITDWCAQATPTFREMKIGNINGYVVSELDNSGGGPVYIGAKGNKYYLIQSYNPPEPNDYQRSYEQVLRSLVF